MRVEESIEINRPVEEVFDYVSDVGNFPEWTGPTMDVRKNTPGSRREDDEFTHAVKFLGRRFETPYKWTSYEPNREYTDRAVGGPVPNHEWYRRHVGQIGMAVRDDWQGKGIGTALMEAVLDLAENWLGLTRIELSVYTDNAAAVALYEKFGFEIEGTHRRYAFRNGEYVDAYSMARIK